VVPCLVHTCKGHAKLQGGVHSRDQRRCCPCKGSQGEWALGWSQCGGARLWGVGSQQGPHTPLVPPNATLWDACRVWYRLMGCRSSPFHLMLHVGCGVWGVAMPRRPSTFLLIPPHPTSYQAQPPLPYQPRPSLAVPQHSTRWDGNCNHPTAWLAHPLPYAHTMGVLLLGHVVGHTFGKQA
jgi:hypothetical protein